MSSAGYRYEQENDLTDGLVTDRPKGLKLQTNNLNHKPKPLTTPSAKNSLSLKTGDKSSRKAFGNVSNVLRSTTQTSIGSKSETKGKASVKACEDSANGVNTEDKKQMIAKKETQSETKVEPKFLDEIENMFPIEEELVSDSRDPMTSGLFSDDRLVAEMAFDNDFCESLVPNPKQDFDFDQFF